MSEFFIEHLPTIIAFITGGGLLTVLTARATRQKAEANAMKAVQEVYQETIKDLRKDKDQMKKENDDFRQKIAELRQKVNDISKELASIRRYKCTVLDCSKRRVDL